MAPDVGYFATILSGNEISFIKNKIKHNRSSRVFDVFNVFYDDYSFVPLYRAATKKFILGYFVFVPSI